MAVLGDAMRSVGVAPPTDAPSRPCADASGVPYASAAGRHCPAASSTSNEDKKEDKDSSGKSSSSPQISLSRPSGNVEAEVVMDESSSNIEGSGNSVPWRVGKNVKKESVQQDSRMSLDGSFDLAFEKNKHRPTSLHLNVFGNDERQEGSLLQSLRKNSPVEALQEKYWKQIGGYKNSAFQSRNPEAAKRISVDYSTETGDINKNGIDAATPSQASQYHEREKESNQKQEEESVYIGGGRKVGAPVPCVVPVKSAAARQSKAVRDRDCSDLSSLPLHTNSDLSQGAKCYAQDDQLTTQSVSTPSFNPTPSSGRSKFDKSFQIIDNIKNLARNGKEFSGNFESSEVELNKSDSFVNGAKESVASSVVNSFNDSTSAVGKVVRESGQRSSGDNSTSAPAINSGNLKQAKEGVQPHLRKQQQPQQLEDLDPTTLAGSCLSESLGDGSYTPTDPKRPHAQFAAPYKTIASSSDRRSSHYSPTIKSCDHHEANELSGAPTTAPSAMEQPVLPSDYNKLQSSRFQDDSHGREKFRPHTWAGDSPVEESKTPPSEIAMDAERIIEQTRKLSSTVLNNLDIPSDLKQRHDFSNSSKKYNIESNRSSPDSNTSIERDSLENDDDKVSNNSGRSANSEEEGVVEGRLSFPLAPPKKGSQREDEKSHLRSEVRRKSDFEEQANNDVTRAARLLARKQNNEAETNDVTGGGRGEQEKHRRQSLQQARLHEIHQLNKPLRDNFKSSCKSVEDDLSPKGEMGGVFSKGRQRGVSQPPSFSPTSPSPSTFVNQPPLRSPRLRSRGGQENLPTSPPYVSQKPEPYKRYSGFSQISSDNVRRMRDVWGARQEKPPAGPPGTPPPSPRNIHSRGGFNPPAVPPRYRPSPPASPLTTRRAPSPAARTPSSTRSPSPIPFRRPGTPTHVSERLAARRAQSPITQGSGSNSPAGKNSRSANASPSRFRSSQSPSHFSGDALEQPTEKSARTATTAPRSSSATRTNRISPDKNKASKSSTRAEERIRDHSTPPSTPTRKTFPTHLYTGNSSSDSSNRCSRHRDSSSTDSSSKQQNPRCRSSPSRESRSPTKMSQSRLSQSHKARAPSAPSSSGAPNTSSATSKTTPTSSTRGTHSTKSKAPSPPNQKPAPSVHKRIYKRFRDSTLRPDSETLCFVEEEDKYKVRRYDNKLMIILYYK